MMSIPDYDDAWIHVGAGPAERARFIEGCVRRINHHVGCSRTGLWVFRGARSARALHCLGMYDRLENRMVQVPDKLEREAGGYFDALRSVGHLLADDTRSHPATRDFFKDHLAPKDVRSLMATAFSLNGTLFGAITCAQVGKNVAWTPLQLAVLTKLGARATLALTHAQGGGLYLLLEQRRDAMLAES